MNKIKQCWLIILWLIFSVGITNAAEYVYSNLDINADVLIDWSMNVSETYTANFYVKKHGIFRNIPLNYSVDWNKFHIDISNINVVWKKYSTTRKLWEWVIKIWDPNYEVYWEVNYPISYTVYWLIKNFSSMWYAELYWNLVWYNFDTSIWKVSAVIKLPKVYTGFQSSDFLITTDWSTATVEQFAWKVDRSQWDKIIITYDNVLSANHWITLAVKFPNNYFEFDHERQASLIGNAKMWWDWWVSFIKNIYDNGYKYIFIFIIAWIIIFTGKIKGNVGKKINLNTYKLKWNFSKKYHTVIQYTPPKWLNSAEVWLLLHRNTELRDLLSLIYKWAAEWLVTIDANVKKGRLWVEVIKNIKINKEKDIPDTAPEFEQHFFKSLLGKNWTDLIWYNKQHITNLNELESHWINQWWLVKKNSLKTLIFAVLFFILIVSFSVFWFLLIILFAIIFWNKLNEKFEETEKWAELIAHILWYRQFLAKCDEPVLKKFLAEDPLFFDKTLPYAVVFGLETEFLKKIMPILEEKNLCPRWYTWDIHNIWMICSTTNSISSSYSSSGWFSGWSSFWWWFSGGWWWWGGWWWSW